MRVTVLFLVCIPVLYSPMVLAVNGWMLAADYRHETVDEYLMDGSKFLRERGNQPILKISRFSDLGPGAFQVAIEHARPSLDYRGRSQNGAAISTRTEYANTRVSATYSLPIFSGWQGRVGLEQELRNRSIHATGKVAGLHENYRTLWEVLGLRWQKSTWRGEYVVSLDWMSSVAGRQKVWSEGVMDPVRFDTGSSEGARLSVEWPVYRSSDAQRLLATAYFESFVIERSQDVAWQRNGVTQGYLAQPETHRKQIGIGLSYCW